MAQWLAGKIRPGLALRSLSKSGIRWVIRRRLRTARPIRNPDSLLLDRSQFFLVGRGLFLLSLDALLIPVDVDRVF